MSNDNGYYNNTGYPYGGGAPVPPPFPGDRRNRGREPYMDAAPGYGGEPYYNLHRHNKRCRRTTLWVLRVLCCHS